MPPARSLPLALTASLAVHLVLVLLVPGMRVPLPITRERLVEVEVASPEPEPRAPATIEPLKQKPEAAPLSEAEAGRLAEAVLGSTRLASAPPPAAPPIRIPSRKVSLPEPDGISWSPPLPAAPDPIPRRPLPQAKLPAAPDAEAARGLAESLLEGATAAGVPLEPPAPEPLGPLEIEGPVGTDREVIYQPAFPSVAFAHPAHVVIKFWVSPRGTVTRTVVERTADPVLDAAALSYVKGVRFNPLPPGEDQEQWGTIRIMFRLE